MRWPPDPDERTSWHPSRALADRGVAARAPPPRDGRGRLDSLLTFASPKTYTSAVRDTARDVGVRSDQEAGSCEEIVS